MTIMANLVAIVGRPNVGKSTLFNRLTQSRRAIVSDTAGTTRDRQYGKCSWNGREFSVVDTGGWVVKSDDIFEDAIRKQVLVATEEADLVLFLVDVNTGLTDWDEDVALILRRAKLPVILVANKVDNSAEYYEAAEFYKLGLGDPQCISAATGGGTGDLLDMILDKLQDNPEEAIVEDIPRFAVVGRPNAGKSSIINAFIGEDRNIVTEIAGTTRDRQYGKCSWNGREFSVVDTGGWVVKSDDIFEDAIRKQVLVATEEADLVLFLVDVNTGLTDWDEDVALILRRAKLPVILVANKVDNSAEYYQAAEFYKLGLGDPQCISAATGGGTGDLLDIILDKLQDNPEEAIEEDIPRFAVVGRPNAGKSSIINAFIGEDRNIVTEIAGTTRDSIYTRYDKFGFDFYLVDTAGIRRKNKVSEDLEFYSVMRSIRAIENSDVCILMLDATRGIETQDMNIFQLIQKNNKSLVVVVNKWDLVENKDQKVITTFETAIRNRMAPFVDFPIIFASALTKQRIFKVLETAKQVYQNRKAHIGTSKLNEVMLPIIEAYPPQSVKGKYIKIKYCTQLPNTTIPSFVFYANLPQYVKENYRRFLENKIRENWSLHGCPINIFIRQK